MSADIRESKTKIYIKLKKQNFLTNCMVHSKIEMLPDKKNGHWLIKIS